MIKKLNTISVILGTDGTLNVVECPVKLHKDSYNFIKMSCIVPITPNSTDSSFVKIYASTIDLSGNEVWTSQTYNLVYDKNIIIGKFEYKLFTGNLPQEFCDTAGDLKITYTYADTNNEGIAIDLLPSATLNLNISGEGFNPNGVVLANNDVTVARVNLLSINSVLRVDISKEFPLNAQFSLNGYKTPFYEFYTTNGITSPLSYNLPITPILSELTQCYVIAKEIVPDAETPEIIGFQTEFAYYSNGVCSRTNKYNITQGASGQFVLLENGTWFPISKEYWQTQIDEINGKINEREYFLGYFANEQSLLAKYPNGTTTISTNSSVGVYSTYTYWEYGDDRIWNDTGEALPQDQTILSDELPIMNGTSNAGTGSRASREDHVHPSDNSKASIDEVVMLNSETTQVINSDLALGLNKKFFGTKKDGAQAILVSVGEYENIEQVEVGSVTEHLNLNTLDKVTYDVKSEDGTLIKKTLVNTGDLTPLTENIATNTSNISTLTGQVETINNEIVDINEKVNTNSTNISINTANINLKLDKANINENYMKNTAYALNGDTVVATLSYKNPVSGVSQDLEITVTNAASSTNAGLMTADMVNALTQAIADIESLKYVGRQLKSFPTYADAEIFDWTTITDTININDYFIVEADETRPPSENNPTTKYVCVSTATPITTTKNFEFQSIVTSIYIQVATESLLGGIISTNTNGYVYVESNGAAKLVGYDAIITSINNLTQELINETNRAKSAEETNATAIQNETERATTAEQTNATAITNETTRATTAEQNLNTLKADKTEIPTKTSQLTNDSNFALTSQIPTKTSQLTNDSNYATVSQIPTNNNQLANGSNFATVGQLPTKTSQLTNDSDFVTPTNLGTQQTGTNIDTKKDFSITRIYTPTGTLPAGAGEDVVLYNSCESAQYGSQILLAENSKSLFSRTLFSGTWSNWIEYSKLYNEIDISDLNISLPLGSGTSNTETTGIYSKTNFIYMLELNESQKSSFLTALNRAPLNKICTLMPKALTFIKTDENKFDFLKYPIGQYISAYYDSAFVIRYNFLGNVDKIIGYFQTINAGQFAPTKIIY